jgi:hypothetical protein
MALDWLLLIAGIAGAAYLLARAEHLAARPRRGTELRPSARTYKLLVIAPLLIAIGSGTTVHEETKVDGRFHFLTGPASHPRRSLGRSLLSEPCRPARSPPHGG